MLYYIGVDIGGTSIKVGLVTKEGELLDSLSIPTLKEEYTVTISKITKGIDELMARNKVKKISGIGIGVPGVTNPEEGTVIKAPNINWKNVNFAADFKNKYKCKVAMENDANCAAVGEYFFGLKERPDNAIFITLGTGIGSGVIINQQLYRGNGFAAGEAGHMTIIKDGILCNCSRKGCWEKYASATALIQQTKDEIKKSPKSLLAKIAKEENVVNGQTAFKAYRKKDPAGKRVVEQYLDYVAVGLVNLAMLLHPSCFIIGGGISNEGQLLIDMLQERVDKALNQSGFLPLVEIRKANLLNKAGILGAAKLSV